MRLHTEKSLLNLVNVNQSNLVIWLITKQNLVQINKIQKVFIRVKHAYQNTGETDTATGTFELLIHYYPLIFVALQVALISLF